MADTKEAPRPCLPASYYWCTVPLLFKTSRCKCNIEARTWQTLLRARIFSRTTSGISIMLWNIIALRISLRFTSFSRLISLEKLHKALISKHFSGLGLSHVATFRDHTAWTDEMWAFPLERKIRGFTRDKKYVSRNCRIEGYGRESCGECPAKRSYLEGRMRQKLE